MLRTYKKSINNKINSSKGFTLTELIVVLAVLGILAALTVPAFSGYINKAKDRQIQDEARKCVMAAQTLLDEEYAASGTVSADYVKKADFRKRVLALAKLDSKAGDPSDDTGADKLGVFDITFNATTMEITGLKYRHLKTDASPTKGDGKGCNYANGVYTSNYYKTDAYTDS